MKKILILEDRKSIQMLYVDELIAEGYEVLICSGGSRLKELIKQEKPDLIVMDIELGRYNDIDLLLDIRNDYSNLPVILCTAYPSFEYDPKLVDADHYVVNNSDIGELKHKIKMALEGSNQISG